MVGTELTIGIRFYISILVIRITEGNYTCCPNTLIFMTLVLRTRVGERG